eukprot:Skav223837  [mRNA]  locus=scaffold1256:209261:220266:- [translate_table: standard]
MLGKKLPMPLSLTVKDKQKFVTYEFDLTRCEGQQVFGSSGKICQRSDTGEVLDTKKFRHLNINTVTPESAAQRSGESALDRGHLCTSGELAKHLCDAQAAVGSTDLPAGNKKGQALAMYLAIHVKVYQEDRTAIEKLPTSLKEVAALYKEATAAAALLRLVSACLSSQNEAEALKYAEMAEMKAKEADDVEKEAQATSNVAEILLRRKHSAGQASAMVVLGQALLAENQASAEGMRYLQAWTTTDVQKAFLSFLAFLAAYF